jgi:DNA-directed RNA polymerase, sigma subunit (sigma70/sigma32)
MDSASNIDANLTIVKTAIDNILNVIEQDREKEIIVRRFGINERKETLEQIGEMLGITRERVRQLEKAIIIRLKIAAEDGKIADLVAAEKLIIRNLTEFGRVAKISDLADKILGRATTQNEKSAIAFISEISASLAVVDDNDKYYQAVGIAEYGDEKSIRTKSDEIVKIIKDGKKPIDINELDSRLNYEHPDHIRALASISKQLASLNNLWGLAKWPTVNPRNIRDKIFVILENNREPMHFSDIAKSIGDSEFKRKDVTTQAIHNELIKDDRFVLIGRGIYALDSWGYAKGTVTDIIEKVLRDADGPLFRDEIVKRVLKNRQVKETTVLLNLQSKPQFKRAGKAMYEIAEEKRK